MKNRFTINEYVKNYDFFTDNKGNKVKRIATWILRIIGYTLGVSGSLFIVWLMMLFAYAMG